MLLLLFLRKGTRKGRMFPLEFPRALFTRLEPDIPSKVFPRRPGSCRRQGEVCICRFLLLHSSCSRLFSLYFSSPVVSPFSLFLFSSSRPAVPPFSQFPAFFFIRLFVRSFPASLPSIRSFLRSYTISTVFFFISSVTSFVCLFTRSFFCLHVCVFFFSSACLLVRASVASVRSLRAGASIFCYCAPHTWPVTEISFCLIESMVREF